MKKFIITLVLILVLIPTCYLTYQHFTKDNISYEEEISTEDLKGKFQDLNIGLDASLATQPLMNSFINYFIGEDKANDLEKNYTNTDPAYKKLVNHETDLIIVTEPSADELAYAKAAKVELDVTKVVNEGFVFFVNNQNPIDNLKLQDIIDIYSGKTTTWDKYGGDNEKIIAYQRPVNSGSQTGMLSLVMKDVKLKEPTTEEKIEDMGEIIDIVADYDNSKYGIGYSYYYYAYTMYHSPNIKFLAINGVKPNFDTIKDGSYPLMSAYYIVTLKDADSKVQEFKKALLSKEGARVAKEAGYVPIF